MSFCSQCGAQMPDGFSFCTRCGGTAAPSTGQTPPPQPAQPYDGQQRKKPRRQTGGIIAIIASGLAVILLFEFVIGPMICGRTIFGDTVAANKALSTGSVEVSSENTVAVIGGVSVDVNALNLSEGSETVTVKKYEQTIGKDGFLGEEYDISLGDTHYLRAPLTVTLPYDKGAAKDSVVCVLHYDSDYGEWIPQNTEIDATIGKVSAKLTSLSPLRLVYFDKDYSNSFYYVRDEGTINATLQVSYNYWDIIKNTSMEPAHLVAQDYITNGNTDHTTVQIINAADDAINAINTYHTLLGAAADTLYATVNTLAETGGTIKNVTDKASKGIGVVSLMIAAGQLAFDLSTKGATAPEGEINETAVNLYKNIVNNTGTLYSFCTGYSSAALSLGFFAVAVTGYMLDTAVSEAQEIQAETVEAVFNAYYRENSFKERDWYNMFVDSYWDAWQNGRDSKEGMDEAVNKVTVAIDAYAEKFWDEIYKDGSDALTFAVADAGKTNYYTPTLEQKEELTERFKKDLFARFNDKVIPWINEFMQVRMQNAVYVSLREAVEPFNKYYRIQIQETVAEDSEDVCKYQMCPIRFGTDDGFVNADYPDEWSLLAPEGDKEWTTALDVTMLGYLMAGAPDKVFVFDRWDENKSFGSQIETRELVLAGEEAGYTTIIDISGETQTGYEGRYSFNTQFFEPEYWESDERGIECMLYQIGEVEVQKDGSFSVTVPAHTVTLKYLMHGAQADTAVNLGELTLKGQIDTKTGLGAAEFNGTATGEWTAAEAGYYVQYDLTMSGGMTVEYNGNIDGLIFTSSPDSGNSIKLTGTYAFTCYPNGEADTDTTNFDEQIGDSFRFVR